MNRKKIIQSVIALSTLPLLVGAAEAGATPATIAAALANQVVLVGTWIVVIMWVVTGILFLTAQGEPEKLKKARTSLFAAIGGTVLIILASGAVAFIKNSLNL